MSMADDNDNVYDYTEYKLFYIVEDLDNKLFTVSEICRKYEVSNVSVYKWLRKYSLYYKSTVKMVVQMDSESKKNEQLKAKIAELERALGQKQMRVDYLEKMIELTSDKYQWDIEKKNALPRSNGSGNTN